MEKVKKISKYVTNSLGMISAILVGLNAIEGITIPYYHQIIEVIVLAQGIIGTYLISGKLFKTTDKEVVGKGKE